MLVFFCGNLNSGQLIPTFTEIKPASSGLDLVNFAFFPNQTLAFDKNKRAYEWHVQSALLNSSMISQSKQSPNKSSGNTLKCYMTPAEEFNQFFAKEGELIIELKTTKSEVLVLDEKCSLSLLSHSYNPINSQLNFSLVASNLIPHENIVKITCGSEHCLALSNKGTAFSWGSNANGRLGQGHTEALSIPKMMVHLLSYNVIDISSGLSHSVALGYQKNVVGKTDSIDECPLKMLVWGEGAQGATGLGVHEDMYIPTENRFFDKHVIKEAFCGHSHTLALTEKGELYSCGSNEFGQLGIGKSKSETEPKLIAILQPVQSKADHNEEKDDKEKNPAVELNRPAIAKVAVGPFHNFCVMDNGEVYSWGLGSYGQLGGGEIIIQQSTPQLINPSPEKLQEPEERTSEPSSASSQVLQTVHYFSQGSMKKALPNLVIYTGIDSTFFLINKRLFDEYKDINDSISVDSSKENSATHGPKDSFINGATGILDSSTVLSKSPMTAKPNVNDVSHISQTTTEFFSNIMDYFSKKTTQQTSNPDDKILDKSMTEQNQRETFRKIKEQDAKEKQEKKLQEKREKKKRELRELWVTEILPFWHSKRQSYELREIWMLGVPPALRDQVWGLAIANRLALTQSYYEIHLAKARMLHRASDFSKDKMNDSEKEYLLTDPIFQKLSKENTIKMIEFDLPRTYPNLAIFNKESPVYDSLRDVLMSFTCARPDVGYVQGMSYIAGLLLLYMQPFDAFRCFSNIICRPSMLPFYLLHEEQIMRRMGFFRLVLENNLKNLCEHFEQEELLPKMYFFEWMITIYTNTLNLDVASRVWDLFFLDGDIILYKTAIAILKLCEPHLMKLELTEIKQFFKTLNVFINDEDKLTAEIYKVDVPKWIIEEHQKLSYEFIP